MYRLTEGVGVGIQEETPPTRNRKFRGLLHMQIILRSTEEIVFVDWECDLWKCEPRIGHMKISVCYTLRHEAEQSDRRARHKAPKL